MTIDQLKEVFNERGIRHVKLGVFDLDGVLRAKYVSPEKFFSAAEGGLGFCDVIFGWDSSDALYDNVKITGWHTGYPDARASADLNSFRVIPWEKDTALFLLDMEMPVAPRRVLHQVDEKARKMGYRPFFSAEYEFFFFRETAETARQKHYRDLTPLSPGMFGYSALRASTHAEFLHQLLDNLREYDVELEGLHTETGPGVYEAAIRYAPLLKAADKAALFKTVVKEIAARNGLIVTFMAKVNASLPGSSGHLHQSLWNADGNKNLFYDKKDPRGISELMRQYIGGQLALMPEVMAMICPTINSYKRTVPGTWAPVGVSWGVENRTTALRAIPGGAKSTRVEYRLAGADGNPYLAMAAALASGLHGIENRMEPAAAVAGSAYDGNLPALPRSLAESTARMKSSAAVRAIFGDIFVDHFTATREWEVKQFEKAVTNWEMERYFEII
jgi:glutamine synthetase